MIDKIIARLKTGTIKNVYEFGTVQTKLAPYIVVKGEKDALGIGEEYRIFVHMPPGQQIALEDYLFNTLSVLLPNGFTVTTRNGNTAELLHTQEWSGTITNDDGTISMERSFLMPLIIF